MHPTVGVAQEKYTCLTEVKGWWALLLTHSSPASAAESICDLVPPMAPLALFSFPLFDFRLLFFV